MNWNLVQENESPVPASARHDGSRAGAARWHGRPSPRDGERRLKARPGPAKGGAHLRALALGGLCLWLGTLTAFGVAHAAPPTVLIPGGAILDRDEIEAKTTVSDLLGELQSLTLSKFRIKRLLKGSYKKDQDRLLRNPRYLEQVRRFNERLGAAPEVTRIRRYSDKLFLVFVRYNLIDGSSTDVMYMVEKTRTGKKVLGEVEDYLVCDRDKKGRSKICD